MEEWQIVFSLVFALTAGHALAAIVLFVWRRHEHPLTGHSLPLMFLTAVRFVCLFLSSVVHRSSAVKLLCSDP